LDKQIKNSREKIQKIIIIHNASMQVGILPTTMTEPCCIFFKDIEIPIVRATFIKQLKVRFHNTDVQYKNEFLQRGITFDLE
jgi:pyruvate/2-oxoglutarate/acetoin dehydrogenase E1 component